MKSDLKIAIYTVILGPYDGLIPQPIMKGVDFICFTDQKYKSKRWSIRSISVENDDPGRTVRKYKTCPHLFLSDYEYSIYMDGNFILRRSPILLIKQALQTSSFAAFDHNQCSDARNCIYDEYEAIMKLQKARNEAKDDPYIMKLQMDFYKNEGFPSQIGLISGGILIRRHNEPLVKKTMELWFQQIQKYSKRDQLSFNYCAWKTGLHIHYLKGDIRRNDHFFLLSKHRPDYRWKYFKYRLKRVVGLI